MKSALTTSRNRLLGLLTLAAVALASGCSSKGSVTGQVTLNGAPIHGGVVTFIGADGERQTANISSEGEYHINGVPPGTVKITVTNLVTNVPMPMTRPAVMKDAHGLPERPTVQVALLPRRYADPENGLT